MSKVDSRSGAQSPPANADDVLRAIRRIVQSITVHSKQLYRQVGLTVPQLLCLSAVGEAEAHNATAADVSRRVHLSPATVTGILDRLERDGWIIRERRDQDRRKVSLSLTPRGADRLNHLPSLLQDRFVERYQALPVNERSELLTALEKVVAMMEAGDIEASPILLSGDVQTPSAE